MEVPQKLKHRSAEFSYSEDFLSSCTNLHSHQQCMRVPFLHILAKLISCALFVCLFVCSFIKAILTAWRSYLIVVLTCISLMVSNEHRFMLSFLKKINKPI